jgi:predicted nucleic acid-binding protein
MFLDTSGLLAYHSVREPQHKDAVIFLESNDRKLTHNYVLAEFVALANARKIPQQPAVAFARAMLQHPLVEVVWGDAELHGEALDLLDERSDKAYSLCDAVSFVLMRRENINEALTTDHHFKQEGFRRLL